MIRPGRKIALLVAAALAGWGGAGVSAADPKPTARPERPSAPPARTFSPPGIAGGPAPDTPSVIPPPPGFRTPPATTPPTSAPAPAPSPAPPTPSAPSAPAPSPAPALPGSGTFAGVAGTLQVQVDDPADGQALALALGLTVRQVSADRRVLSFVAPPGVDLVALLHRLRGDPRVKSADLEALEFPRPTR